ncbi:hypothetical protein C7M71_005240 [Peterkaempfera bronchialis]|uniref:Uncharacterized protein n=2 Tax=Peterkaempfera bronchialis TaxID=2126346 RepID=A0A345ST91_9ACTN|nr:hypothetical protein C7M71_005240 [Peterkaempfera bronchialis]
MYPQPSFGEAADSRSQQQDRIRERLLSFGPGPAGLFQDICTLLDDDRGLQTRVMLIGHLLRELESAVRAILLPDETRTPGESQQAAPETPGAGVVQALSYLLDAVDTAVRSLFQPASAPVAAGPPAPASGNTHRLQVKAVLAALGIPESSAEGRAWLKAVGQQHGHAHRPGLEPPRALDQKFQAYVDGFMQLFDVLLDAFDARYLASAERLDRLAALEHPTKDDAALLFQNFPQDELTRERFFSQLTTPAWLPLLGKVFAHPPTAAVDEEAGRVTFSYWPASAYLARMAAVDPTAVLQIAARIETDNPRVHLDLVEIAVSVPAKKAVQLLPRLLAAVRGPYILAPDRYADLAVHLAGSDHHDAALELMCALLATDAHGNSRIGEWEYGHTVDRANTPMTAHLGVRWAAALVECLDQTLNALQRPGHTGSGDRSEIWYPALDRDQDLAYPGAEVRLTTALRNTATALLSDGTANLAEVLAVLQTRPWTVLRRLRLHMLDRHAEAGGALVADALTDQATAADEGLEREWLLLARNHAVALDTATRTQVLAAVDAGPDAERWSREYQQRYNTTIDPEKLTTWTDLWRRDRYTALEPVLSAEQRTSLSDLVGRYGAARDLDKVPHSGMPLIDPPASETPGDLAMLDTAELVARAAAWEPEPSAFGGTNQSAYSSVLREAVTAQGGRHSNQAQLFADLVDTYLVAALSGFQAAAHSTMVEWAPLVDLAQHAADRQDTGLAHELHRVAAELLITALNHRINPPAPVLAMPTWNVITAVLAAPDTLAAAEEPGLYWYDARAQALRAAVAWASWSRAHDLDVSPAFDLLQDASMAGPAAAEIRATVLGERFPQLTHLDPTWGAAVGTDLFNSTAAGATAWNAYLSAAPFDHASAELLLGTYRDQAEKDTEDGSDRSARLRFALGRHILALYWADVIDLTGGNGLVASYYTYTSTSVLQQLDSSIAMDIRAGVSPEVAPRVKAWWQWRLGTADDETPPLNRELGDIAAALAASGQFPGQWGLQQMQAVLDAGGQLRPDDTTFGFLTAVVVTETTAVLVLLRDWFAGLDQYATLPRYRETDIRTLLRTGLADPKNETLAREIISRAAARGHHQFRTLLNDPVERPAAGS